VVFRSIERRVGVFATGDTCIRILDCCDSLYREIRRIDDRVSIIFIAISEIIRSFCWTVLGRSDTAGTVRCI
jgi:hypothetical protein